MGQQLMQWLLKPENWLIPVAVLIAFLVGLLAGYALRRRNMKKDHSQIKRGDNAFFKGIQYLLSNDQDQAIEEFTKSVQVNSDTIETYVALGNLYRLKGDIDRAIRIRQTIILRPNIDEETKLRALFDLGLDYRKGGFLNRALDVFLNVYNKRPTDLETLKEIEKIYEEMKDWENAFTYRRNISRLVDDNSEHILAHHQTEIGKACLEKGEISKAKAAFKKAISIHEGCIDAYLHLGDYYFSIQSYNKAIATWKKIVMIAPSFTFLAYRRLEGAYSKMENLQPVEDFLKECSQFNSDSFTHLALARYLYNEKDYNGALRELESAIEIDPSFWEARRLMGEILLADNRKEEALIAYGKLITHLNVPDLEFQCTNCGFIPTDLHWQCPQCKKWDTIYVVDTQMIDSPLPINTQRIALETPQTDVEEDV